MMYCAEYQPDLGNALSDGDLERFDWWELREIVGGIRYRILQAECPA